MSANTKYKVARKGDIVLDFTPEIGRHVFYISITRENTIAPEESAANLIAYAKKKDATALLLFGDFVGQNLYSIFHEAHSAGMDVIIVLRGGQSFIAVDGENHEWPDSVHLIDPGRGALAFILKQTHSVCFVANSIEEVEKKAGEFAEAVVFNRMEHHLSGLPTFVAPPDGEEATTSLMKAVIELAAPWMSDFRMVPYAGENGTHNPSIQ